MGCEGHKNHLLEGMGPLPVGSFDTSLIKIPQEWSCPCGGFLAVSQGQIVDWTWSWRIKSFYVQWVALLAP